MISNASDIVSDYRILSLSQKGVAMALDLTIPVNGGFVAEVWGTLYGQETRTRFMYKNKSGGDLSILTEAVPGFLANHFTSFRGLISTDWNAWNVRGYAYGALPTPTPLGFRDTPVSVGGLDAGTSHPPTVAGVLRRRVGTPGRANRGRIYVPAIPNTSTSAGRIQGGILATWSDVCVDLGLDCFDEAETTAILEPVLMKRNALGAVTTWQVLSYWDFDPILRSQRRREIGVGI